MISDKVLEGSQVINKEEFSEKLKKCGYSEREINSYWKSLAQDSDTISKGMYYLFCNSLD